MRTQEFVQEGISIKRVMEAINNEINSFLGDYDTIVSISHSTVIDEDNNFIATAILCYDEG